MLLRSLDKSQRSRVAGKVGAYAKAAQSVLLWQAASHSARDAETNLLNRKADLTPPAPTPTKYSIGFGQLVVVDEDVVVADVVVVVVVVVPVVVVEVVMARGSRHRSPTRLRFR